MNSRKSQLPKNLPKTGTKTAENTGIYDSNSLQFLNPWIMEDKCRKIFQNRYQNCKKSRNICYREEGAGNPWDAG